MSSEHIVDLELMERRCNLLQAEGRHMVSVSLAGMRELVRRLRKAEMQLAPTATYPAITNEQIEACRLTTTLPDGSDFWPIGTRLEYVAGTLRVTEHAYTGYDANGGEVP